MKQPNTVRKHTPEHTPEKLHRIRRLVEKQWRIEDELDNLGEEIAIDIIDGWTTGDPLLDFALVACDGGYNEEVYSRQYQRLLDVGLRKPSQKIMVVQKAVYADDKISITLRKIQLAILRAETTDMDIDNLLVRVPVQPGYLSWQEIYQTSEGLLATAHQLIEDEWLITGPTYNPYCDFGQTQRKEGGLQFVPDWATCDIDPLPQANKQDLFLDHGVDSELLGHLLTTWTRDFAKWMQINHST